jgi:hypothetical protein
MHVLRDAVEEYRDGTRVGDRGVVIAERDRLLAIVVRSDDEYRVGTAFSGQPR